MKLLASHPRYRALSQGEQASVARVLSGLAREPSDEEIAVALAELGGNASQPHTAAFRVVEGGRHKAIQNPDGTWDILDVPVFSEIPEGVKRAPKPVTKKDLEACVKRAWRRRTEDSFLSSLHVIHNDRGKAIFAGYFFPREVRMFRLEGKERATIFADFLSVPDHIFRAMERGELPHRSVEIRTYEPLEFSSCALLDTEDPYWRYPIFSVGEKIQLAEGAQVDLVQGEPLVAFAAAGEKVAACFRYREDPASFADDGEEEEEKEKGGAGEEDGGDEAGQGEEFEAGTGTEQGTTAVAVDLRAVQEALSKAAELNSQAAQILVGLSEHLTGGQQATEGPAQPNPAEQGDAGEQGGNEQMKKKEEASMSNVDVEARAELAATKNRVRSLEKDREIDAFVAGAVKKLEASSIELTDEDRAELRTFYAMGKDAGDKLVATYQRVARRDPSPNLADAEARGRQMDAPEVARYAAEGPEILERVRKHADTYQRAVSAGHINPRERSLESFIKTQLRSEAARF